MQKAPKIGKCTTPTIPTQMGALSHTKSMRYYCFALANIKARKPFTACVLWKCQNINILLWYYLLIIPRFFRHKYI